MSSLRIGELAKAAGVSTRTVRYYDQRGLLIAPAYSAGGERRYDEASLLRLRRIRELAQTLGSDLERIGDILEAEDRLAALRSTVRPDDSPAIRLERLAQAEKINTQMQEQVGDRMDRLADMLVELKARALYYAQLRAELQGSRT